MKIVNIIPSLNRGGAEILAVSLAMNFFEKGQDVSFVVIGKSIDDDLIGEMKRVGIKVFCLRMESNLRAVFKIREILKILSPDIVQSHLHAIDLLGYSVFTYKKPNYFHTIHNLAEKDQEVKHVRFLRMPLIFFKFIHLVSISSIVSDSIKRTYKVSPSITINNGVADTKGDINFNRFNGERKFVAIGRYSKQKNFMCLPDIFEKINNERCFVIGAKSDDYGLRQSRAILELGVRQDVREIMKEMQFLILPSLYEGHPLVVLEAFAAGCIVIATPVGGVLDIVTDRKNGFLLPDPSSENFIDEAVSTIKFILSMESERLEEVAITARKDYLANYTDKRCAERYLKLYRCA